MLKQTTQSNKTDDNKSAQSDHAFKSSESNESTSPKSLRSKLAHKLKQQARRGKVVLGLSNTMIGGYRAATKIDAWREPPREILPKYIQAFCRQAAGVFGVQVVEVEPVPQRHALWVCNHISWMDIPVMGTVTPAFFLSKAEVEKMPVFGVLAKAAGTLFINRGSGDAASVATQMTTFLKQGYSVLFYPEATTTDGTHIKKLHGKLLQAAIDADTLVQPMVICYVNHKGKLDETVPFYGGISLKHSLFRVIDSEPVTAFVLPLEPLSPTGKTREELTAELQDHMQAGLEELHSRVLNKKQDSA